MKSKQTSNNKTGVYQKLGYLLSAERKKQLLVLSGLLFIGMLFEMAGLGMLIPALGIILNPNIGEKYPELQPYLSVLGNPTQFQLAIFGMIALVFVYFVKAVFLLYLNWRQSKFASELSAELSQKLFLGYLRQPYTFHLQRNSAQLLRNIQSEIVQFTGVSQAAINLTIEFSAVIGIAIMLILVEPIGAIVVTIFLAASALIFHRLTKDRLLQWGQSRQYHSGYANQHLLQGLGGVKDVKVGGKEEYFLAEYNYHNEANAKIQTKVITLAFVPRSYLELLSVVGLAGLIILMMMQGKTIELLLPVLGVFVAAAFRLIPSVNRIMASIQTIRYSFPVMDVLYSEFRMIKKTEEITRAERDLEFKEIISIKDVSFQYPSVKNKALKSISLFIRRGESIGFIGPSGSGKSTLVDIILGLLPPDDGTVTVDGHDIREAPSGWMKQIGYVPQSIFLTDDTLRSNIAFGIPQDKIEELALQKAIDSAQLTEFISGLPKGLDTVVGERGVRLSGGQRQRIGIARALYHNPQLLILDESTSSLDTETEANVMKSITALQGQKTLIIVAHRLSTVDKCDRIYRLVKGHIIEEGSPELLLSQK